MYINHNLFYRDNNHDFHPQSKEYNMMYSLNTYDYGARQYDPARITWDRMDQLCEKYYNINPYVYCAGNPVNRIDLDGREVKIVVGKTPVGQTSINLYSSSEQKKGIFQEKER